MTKWYVFIDWDGQLPDPRYANGEAAHALLTALRGYHPAVFYDTEQIVSGLSVSVEADLRGEATALAQYVVSQAMENLELPRASLIRTKTTSQAELDQWSEQTLQFHDIVDALKAEGFHPDFPHLIHPSFMRGSVVKTPDGAFTQ